MKHRRELAPKKQKNTTVLVKFTLLALVSVLIGLSLAYLADYLVVHFIGPPAAGDEKKASFLYDISGIIEIATLITVLAMLFFGIRGFLSGTKARASIQSSRMKIKKP